MELAKPNVGIHKYRLFNLAIVDVIGTLIIAIVIAFALRINLLLIIVLLFLLSILAHRYFRVRTTVDKLLFPELNEK